MMSQFMERGLNVTYLTLGGHVELHKYRYLYFLILFTVYIFIVFSDTVVVCLICTRKNLHDPMYIFIAALLLNSLMGSTAIHPKLLIDFLSENQLISYSACLFQASLVYSLGGSSFLLLSVMAYDRYVSICKPLQYPTIMRTTTVTMLLVLAWVVPACVVGGSILLITRLKLCRFILNVIFCDFGSVAKLSCGGTTVYRIYGVLCLINIIFLPVVFIAFTYTRILIICLRSSKDVKKKAVQTCLPHLLVLINYSILATFEMVKNREESDIPNIIRFIMTFQVIVSNPLFNPIIYGLKMQEISKRLKRLLCVHKVN